MSLQRDWEAVYYAHHGHWDVIATQEGGDPEDASDRYSIFDSDEIDGEQWSRLIAAAPAMLAKLQEVRSYLMSRASVNGPTKELMDSVEEVIAMAEPGSGRS